MSTILVVEDHVETNELLCKLLQRAGHKAICAFTGEGGLAMVATERPDLIILDQMMPGMDGIEVLRILRANPKTAFIPVVIYSAMAEPVFVEHARRKAANDVGSKARWTRDRFRHGSTRYWRAENCRYADWIADDMPSQSDSVQEGALCAAGINEDHKKRRAEARPFCSRLSASINQYRLRPPPPP